MGKVVYNACYGGFGLSEQATKMLAEKKGLTLYEKEDKLGYVTKYTDPDCTEYFSMLNIERHDPDLVAVVEMLGDEANGFCSKLHIAEVASPYHIDEYDGYESVVEPEDIFWKYA